MSVEIENDSMAKERLSIEIGDIRERVEKCRIDPVWRELSLSGKLRALIVERLEELEAQNEGAKK